eukprot:5450966-Lingulodinium_polyedra.AAC.1
MKEVTDAGHSAATKEASFALPGKERLVPPISTRVLAAHWLHPAVSSPVLRARRVTSHCTSTAKPMYHIELGK